MSAALDAERSVLAAMLLDRDAIGRARGLLDPSAFGRAAYQRIFGAIVALDDRGEKVDSITLADELRRRGDLEAAGGPAALSQILDYATTSANIEAHARIVLAARWKREVGRAAQEVVEHVKRGDGVEEVSALVAKLGHLPRDPMTKRARSRAQVTRFADVEPLPVEWLWRGWIPLGMVTVFDGDPGLGKSTLTLDLAARISRGDMMPDGSPGPEAAGVVILSAEDDLARVIRPRLESAGADLERIATVRVTVEGESREPTISPDDLAAVEDGIRRAAAKLVIVDPLMAYLPADVNAHRDQDVRRALGWLRALAERTGAAVIVIRHLNKADSANALYRGGGSIGIIGAARAGLMLAADPDDGEARILVIVKANLAPRPPSLRLRLVAAPGGSHPRVSWEGESAHTPATLLALPQDPEEREAAEDVRGAVEEAVEFLREVLVDGAVPAAEVKRQALEAGISLASLKRAKRVLGFRARKVGRLGEEQRWEWSLREDPPRAVEAGLEGRAAPMPRGDDPLEPLRQIEARKSLSEAENPEGARGAHSPSEVEPLRRSGGVGLTSEDGNSEGTQGAHAAGGMEAGRPVAAPADGARGDPVPICPECGGRLLRWDFGLVCTSCRRRFPTAAGPREDDGPPPLAVGGSSARPAGADARSPEDRREGGRP